MAQLLRPVIPRFTSLLLWFLNATRRHRHLRTQMMVTSQFAFSSPPRTLSSSPLPSPGAVIRQFCSARTETDIYEIHDSQEDEPEPEKPPAKPRAKRKVAESTTKKTRAPALKATTTNKAVKAAIKSKYFVELEEPDKEEMGKPKPARKPAVRKKASTATATTTAPDSVATSAPLKAMRKKPGPKGKSKAAVVPESSLTGAAPAPEPTVVESSPVRRRIWTPPVEDTSVNPPGIQKEDGPKEMTNFSDKIGDLVYKSVSPQEGAERVPSIPTDTGASGTRKRRIEMVDLPSKPKAAPKPKKPKKKAATLTERASAQYRKDVPPPSSQITGYFSVSKTAASKSTKAKNTLKPITTNKRKRGDEDATINLLSPTSARQRIDSQGFVFGTCSQLEKELIETDDAYPSSPSRRDSADTIPDVNPFDPAVVGASYGGGLWGAAKRDQAGGLLRNEDPDFGDIQKPSKTMPSASPMAADETRKLDHGHEHAKPVVLPQLKRVTIDLTLSSSPMPVPEVTDRLCLISPLPPLPPLRPLSPLSPLSSLPSLLPLSPISPLRSLPSALPISSSSGPHTLTDDTGRSVIKSILEPVWPQTLPMVSSLPAQPQKSSFSTSAALATSARRITATTQAATTEAATAKAPAASKPRKNISPSAHPGMPDFNSYLTTRLQSELTKLGFKKIGGRAAMVSCMEKCWLAQNSNAQPRKEQERKSDSPPSPRAGSRSRTGSPAKRTRARSASAKPQPHASSKAPDAGKSTRGKKKPERTPEQTKQLYQKIAEAVKTSGRAGDTSSFYFRILMYDPIILEELMAWLNNKGLESVDVTDQEVSAVDVRAWCDGNGVCLANEMTQKGLERKRF